MIVCKFIPILILDKYIKKQIGYFLSSICMCGKNDKEGVARWISYLTNKIQNQ